MISSKCSTSVRAATPSNDVRLIGKLVYTYVMSKLVTSSLRLLLVFILATLILASPLLAQITKDPAKRISENSQALRQYSWTMRTEARLQGQQLSATLEKMRYDLDGKLQATPLGGSGQLSSEMQQAIDALTRLGFAYAQPDPAKAQRFFAGASIWEGGGKNAGTGRIEGEDFLIPGDEVDLRTKNQLADRMEVETSQNGTPVSVRAEYMGVSGGGPRYVARLTVTAPSQALEVIVESFDYQKSGVVAAADTPNLPEGTDLQVRLTQALSSQKNKSGQTFAAVVESDIIVNGRKAVPGGSRVTGQLVEVKGSGRIRGRAKIAMKLTSLTVGSQTLSLETNTLTIEAEGSGRRDTRRIVGATGIGALIGGIAGGGDGAAKGLAIGAGIGVGATLMTKGKEVEFPVEQLFSFKLLKPVKIGG